MAGEAAGVFSVAWLWLTLHLRVLQRATPQSPPPPPKAPSPSFELGLSSFPPLPGAAGQLKPEQACANGRGSGGTAVGAVKEQVRTGLHLCARRPHHLHLSVCSCQDVSPDPLPGGSPSLLGPREPLRSSASAPLSFQPSTSPAPSPALTPASGPRHSPATA